MTIRTPADRQPAAPSLVRLSSRRSTRTLRADRRIHLDRLARLDEAATESFDDQAATSALRNLLLEIDAALQRIDHSGVRECRHAPDRSRRSDCTPCPTQLAASAAPDTACSAAGRAVEPSDRPRCRRATTSAAPAGLAFFSTE